MSLATIATVTAPPPIPPIRTREELIDALGRAAEIEHAIMCQYLYAAFSLDFHSRALAPADSETVRGFVMSLLLIARQEMEHLGLVSNLLVAVGAPPNFDRPNLPLPPYYYQLDLPLALLPFGDEFLALAERLEAPCDDPTPHHPHPYFTSIAAIYERLRDGFETLGAPGAPTAATLFLGARAPQPNNVDFGAEPGQIWYDLTLFAVTDLATALAAIDLIRVQGEGATPTVLARGPAMNADTTSHHARVLAMRAAWAALDAEARAAALRPVPANPVSYSHGDVDPDASTCLFRDPAAVALAGLGVRSYELILLLLARLYGTSDATADDRAMYLGIAFFPLMTTVVRPVGELLVQLPAGDGRHSAAFTFELDGPIRAYPDRASFHLQLGERMSALADGFAALAAGGAVPPRIGFVAKNVAYIRDRILAYAAEHP